jgi:hypothetical protein
MQIVSLDPLLHFDLQASILGWLLAVVQPKLHIRSTISELTMSNTGMEKGFVNINN